MKRSEMVRIIEMALIDTDDGSTLLDIIEQAGMLPPAIRCGGYTSDANGYDNQWDKEDKHWNCDDNDT